MKKKINVTFLYFGLIYLCISLSSCLQKQSDKPLKAFQQNKIRNTNQLGMPGILVFTLIEAKTNKPMANQEIDVNYFGMVYDAPPDLEFIKKITTDPDGQFHLPTHIFGNRKIGINCGEDYRIIDFGIRQNEIGLRRLNNDFGNVHTITCYQLEKNIEINYNVVSKDSVISKMSDIKLIAYDKFPFDWKFAMELRKDQSYYKSHQKKLWQNSWALFQEGNRKLENRFYQTNYWRNQVSFCENMFPLNVETLLTLAKKAKEKEEKYYFLYTTCESVGWKISFKQNISIHIIQDVINEVKKFYAQNNDIKQQVENANSEKDELWLSYLYLQKYLTEKN